MIDFETKHFICNLLLDGAVTKTRAISGTRGFFLPRGRTFGAHPSVCSECLFPSKFYQLSSDSKKGMQWINQHSLKGNEGEKRGSLLTNWGFLHSLKGLQHFSHVTEFEKVLRSNIFFPSKTPQAESFIEGSTAET